MPSLCNKAIKKLENAEMPIRKVISEMLGLLEIPRQVSDFYILKTGEIRCVV